MKSDGTGVNNKSENVYIHIRDMILRKDIEGGERIPEENIAERLNVSRTPIREALRRLSKEGLVNIYPRRSADVVVLDEKSIQDIGMTRLFLDELSVLLVIQHGSNADFEDLDKYVERGNEFVKKRDRFNAVRVDTEFHMKIAEISGNSTLYRILEDLHLRVKLIQITKLKKDEDLIDNLYLHRPLVEAIKERDSEKAVALVREHLVPFYKLQNCTVIRQMLG